MLFIQWGASLGAHKLLNLFIYLMGASLGGHKPILYFETKSCYVAKLLRPSSHLRSSCFSLPEGQDCRHESPAPLRLALNSLQAWLASNSGSSCHSLLELGFMEICCNTWLDYSFKTSFWVPVGEHIGRELWLAQED